MGPHQDAEGLGDARMRAWSRRAVELFLDAQGTSVKSGFPLKGHLKGWYKVGLGM